MPWKKATFPPRLSRTQTKNNMKILFWLVVIGLGALIPFVPAYNVSFDIPLWIIVVCVGVLGFIKTLL